VSGELYPIRPHADAEDDDRPGTYPMGPPTPTTEVEGGEDEELEAAARQEEAGPGVDGGVFVPARPGAPLPRPSVAQAPGPAPVGAGGDDEPEHPAEEARAARPSRDPGAPTQADRDAHAATHLPFRSWCDACVQGRRDAPPHCRQKRAAGEVPEVAFDYAYARRDDEEEMATLLVMRDRDSKAVRAWVLEHKGADLEETVDRAVTGIRELGYRGRVLIRTDGEPALLALRNAIIKGLPDGATPVVTPVGESQSNGGVEGAVKIVKGILRVHLMALEAKIGARFPSGHPVLAWLVEHVTDVISKYMIGVDGKTGYERLFGRPSREEGLEFGELLHWRHRASKDMNVVLDARWSSGVWLGRAWGGIVHQVYANGKVHAIRGVQRQPRDARWRKEALEEIRATPWNRAPAAEGEMIVLPPLAAPAAAQGPAAEEVREISYNPHRVHIRMEDLELHGFTAGCRRCGLMRNGLPALGVKHIDACRTRVEQAMRAVAHPRLQRAEGRAQDEVERRAHAAAAGEEGAAPRAAPPEGPGVDGGALVPARPAAPAAFEDDAWRQLLRPMPMGAPSTPIADAEAVGRGASPQGQPPPQFDAMQDDADDNDMLMRMRATLAAGGGPRGLQPLGLQRAMRIGPAAVVELYSPPRVTASLPRPSVAQALGPAPVGGDLVAGSTFDLHADADGVRWDFSKPTDRKRAFDQIRAEEPFLVVGSPPCTMFSSMQNMNKKRGKAEWQERRHAAEILLTFAAAVYKLQVSSGRHFLHEHPAGATSWRSPAIAKLLATPGVSAVVAHQCAFGLQTSAPGGGHAPAKKPTRFMSSAPAVLEALSRRCPGGHPHAPLVGGTRARDAATYPPGLCEAIARGAEEQLRRDKRACGIRAMRAWRDARGLHAVRAAKEVGGPKRGRGSFSPRTPGPAAPTECCAGPWSRAGRGGEVHAEAAQGHTQNEEEQLAAWAQKEVYDEITGAALPPDLVRQARAEELTFMREWGVWKRARITECWQETGKAPIGSKWVDVNKGDATKPMIRSRFVVKEIATYKSDDFFAATPPLEALRLLLAMAASSGHDIKVEVLDARKAHLHAFADRTVFVQLPPEEAEPGVCAKLVRCLYGTRDAPKRWEAFLSEQLVAMGFARGRASPCCYYHAPLGVRCIVHGDDFVLTGRAGALDEVKVGMHARFLLKELGRLGGGQGELREMRVLNRVIQWTPAGLKYEADPRHAEIVVRGVAGAERALSTPGTSSREFEATPGDGESLLPERTASLFRSFAARANYLALDRPDIAQATKELCRRMSAPKAADLRALARVARYLAGAGRVVYEYPWQSRPVLRVFTDSDFAGCVATRLSTSGGAVMLGTHLLKHWASTQKRITLSSGEAELGAVVRGFSEALGIQSVARDLGVELQPEVHADSSAAIGICRRSGIGKVRHLAVSQLWVQDLVRSRECSLHKVLGTENPADLMTKPLPRSEIDGHLGRLGLSRATGRAETAPRADAEVDTTLARRLGQ
jgi:hypothetical protein